MMHDYTVTLETKGGKRRGQKIARRRGWVAGSRAACMINKVPHTTFHFVESHRFLFLTLCASVPQRAQRWSPPLVAACKDRVMGLEKLASFSLSSHWQISAGHTRNNLLFFFPLFIDKLRVPLNHLFFSSLKQSKVMKFYKCRLGCASLNGPDHQISARSKKTIFSSCILLRWEVARGIPLQSLQPIFSKSLSYAPSNSFSKRSPILFSVFSFCSPYCFFELS